ncbi:hypothetical protein BJ508DRAFT_357543 [Ascobolus immersus RN42]|uniref:Uncharacterized protein n=1 Tax=Ascobolus immersus RN42 TaxID=1160509 RepID=A0A3N4IS96_ASCIM|nr:hypothetical protein BJ508DRAFT_357543 [Ascobolus immersus RN42]
MSSLQHNTADATAEPPRPEPYSVEWYRTGGYSGRLFKYYLDIMPKSDQPLDNHTHFYAKDFKRFDLGILLPELYCVHALNDTALAGMLSGALIPELVPITEKLVESICQPLEFARPNSVLHDFRKLLFQKLTASKGPLRLRYKHGLLRNNQLELIKVVLENLLAGIEDLSEILEGQELKDGQIVLIRRAAWLLHHFILSERFRSERLELLLLKYIKEEGVNMEVVRGLQAKGELFEVPRYGPESHKDSNKA